MMDTYRLLCSLSRSWCLGHCRGCSDPKNNKKATTEITLSANNTIEQIQPVISKIDGMVDELLIQLSLCHLHLMQKVDEAAENANTSLESLNRSSW